MDFTLIDTNWGKVFDDAVSLKETELRIVCPFLKRKTVQRLLRLKTAKTIRVITRFNLPDFCAGVSDLAALRDLLAEGAEIRGVRGLHAKVYLFGTRRTIVTSANLTAAALSRNEEFGFVADETAIMTRCQTYFDGLWGRSGANLTEARIAEWERKIGTVNGAGARPSAADALPDEGVNLGPQPEMLPLMLTEAEAAQAFVKFFGQGDDRQSRDQRVLDEVKECGSHWACTYPKGKRPRAVPDGAVMFMGRLVSDPDDIIIHGRAIAMSHVEARDDATAKEIGERDWKERWPHYIRVHHAEFMAGKLGAGVSLGELMDALGSEAFASTQRNNLLGDGNTDPRMALRQQPHVELSAQGHAWVHRKLEEAFTKNGKISKAELEALDWPANNPAPSPATAAVSGLSPVGLRMLRTLVRRLRDETVDVKRPETFPSYKDTISAMGIEPWPEGRLGPQFNKEGGHDLCEWLIREKLPALTGLVVNRVTSMPGGDYFKAHGRTDTDYEWWMAEMEKAEQTDWEKYC
jgi:hypothetical protein